MKKRTTHNRYVAEFDLVCDSVEEGLAYVQAYPDQVKDLMGAYLDQMAALAPAA